jgi:hypothetical protein
MHYRQRIRDAVAARLLAANTLAGFNVFTSRARPILEILQKRESVLSIYTADESSKRSGDFYLMERTLTVSIEGAAGGGDDIDDILDQLAAQVEAAIESDPTLENLLTGELVLTSTSSEISARGNQQVGAFRMDFECSYMIARQPEEAAGTLPTSITINGTPTPTAYVQPLDDARTTPPAIVPGDITQTVAMQPPLASRSACRDGTCDLPEWAGDQP